MFVLIMKEGPTPGQRTELGGQQRSLLMGRDPVCNLVINDVEVSRRHARLVAQSGGYAIEDLGSTNGTFVDDQRIKDVVALKPGCSVRLGDRVSFSYEAIPADEAATISTPIQPINTGTTPRYMPAPRYTGPLHKPPSTGPLPPRHTGELPDALEASPGESMPVPAPAPRRPRRGGIRLPLFTERWMLIAAILLVLGSCAAIFIFWYIDANYLWCDVFGHLIPACP